MASPFNRQEKQFKGSSTTRILMGFRTLSHCFRMAFLAPSHFPGPVRRYWQGEQGPKKIFIASMGSLRSRAGTLGLIPMKEPSSSQYTRQSVFRTSSKDKPNLNQIGERKRQQICTVSKLKYKPGIENSVLGESGSLIFSFL